jgi:hypothetical protein
MEEEAVTNGPDERDIDATETRTCAICGHDEDEHELVEVNAHSRTICRLCDDAHDFEPEQRDE